MHSDSCEMLESPCTPRKRASKTPKMNGGKLAHKGGGRIIVRAVDPLLSFQSIPGKEEPTSAAMLGHFSAFPRVLHAGEPSSVHAPNAFSFEWRAIGCLRGVPAANPNPTQPKKTAFAAEACRCSTRRKHGRHRTKAGLQSDRHSVAPASCLN